METNEKKSLLVIIAAIPFAIIAIHWIWIIISTLSYGGSPAIWVLLWMLASLAMTVLLAMRMHSIVLLAPAALFALLDLRSFFMMGMTTGGVDFRSLFSALTMIVFCVIMILNLKEKAQALWFIPGIIASLYAAGTILFNIGHLGAMIDYNPEYLSIWLWSYIFYPILFTAGVWLAGRWFAYPCGAPQKSATSQSNGAAVSSSGNGYRDMLPHILLLLFTCGVYYYYWIYKATEYLNCLEDEEPRNPTTKLLLCMFIPFYSIYWTYKSAQRIDRLAQTKGVPSDLTTLCLILAIFVGIIPPMLMQDKINAVVLAENGTAPRQSAASYQTASDRQTGGIGVTDELKGYKELLDQGVITQEEFDAKKKQLLGL